MIMKLALRNLFHDRLRFLVTLTGILFAVVLVSIQLGFYLGAKRMITGVIEHADCDFWIAPYGTASFEQARTLTGRERFTALAVPGVSTAIPLVVSFAEWRKPDDSTVNVVLIGADAAGGGLLPWNIVEGTARQALPSSVVADRTYLATLGIADVGDTAEIGGVDVHIAGLTEGIRSFTTSPYIFMPLDEARKTLGIASDQATFYLLKLKDGADAAAVQSELKKRISSASVYTKAEFVDRNLSYWLFGTGAGVALLGGAVLGLIVGTVVVAQTLYSSTIEHMNEFATLRALGSPARYIVKVILAQAAISACIGFLLGISIAAMLAASSGATALPIVMTPALALTLFGLTLCMCAVSALSSIAKVTKIDPAMVFAR